MTDTDRPAPAGLPAPAPSHPSPSHPSPQSLQSYGSQLTVGEDVVDPALVAADRLRRPDRRGGGDPGTLEDAGPTGLPVWVGVQHFINLLLLLFILRSGLQILSDHPRLYWTRHSTPGKDWFRIQKPFPPDPLWTAKQDSISLPGQVGLPGIRHSIGLARWWHLGTSTLWLLNGLVFFRSK